MKQKLLSLLALMLACTQHVRADELVAPVEPQWEATPTTLESGKVYYLYNPATERYLTEYSSSYCGASKDFSVAQAVVLTQTGNGWTMQRAEKGDYLWGASSYANNGKTALDTYCYWTIVPATADGSYNIMRSESNPNYVANKYVGYSTSSSYASNTNYYVYADRSYSANCDWQLIDAEVRERYIAKKRLYDAVCMSQVRNVYVPNYVHIYENESNYAVRELYAAAIAVEKAIELSSGTVSVDNEFPLLIESVAGSWGSTTSSSSFAGYGTNGLRTKVNAGSTNAISITAKVDNDAVFFYSTYAVYKNINIHVYVDGVLVRTLDRGMESAHSSRFFEEVAAGEHRLEIRYTNVNTTNSNYDYAHVGYVGVMDMQQISVNLLEPGSLGTEVLYNVDGLKDIKSLKIKGKMNSDDWDKIAMMNRLVNVDLSEADITTIPSSKFKGYVHKVVLPEGLTAIEEKAFFSSSVEYVNIPSTVETIGDNAFKNTNIREISLPNSVTSIGSYVFQDCYRLREASLPSSLKTVSSYAFDNCNALKHCYLAEGIENIYGYAFRDCHNLRQSFPESLKTIGSYAYYNSTSYSLTGVSFSYGSRGCLSCETDSVLTIPANVTEIGDFAFNHNSGFNKVILKGGTSIGNYAFGTSDKIKDLIIEKANTIGYYAFKDCSSLEYIELPVDFYHITTQNNIFSNCPKVNKIVLRSPTVVTCYYYNNTKYGLGCDLSKVDLVVPDYLINQYKLDSYWYNYKTISGFSTADITDWRINMPLVLDAHGRFEGNPNITINGGSTDKPSLKINGDAPMAINNLYFNGSYSNTYYNYPGQILSNCDNITVTGDIQTTLWSKAKYWYFYSLPFDVKISEITHSAEGVQKAVRYYDGANRAENGRTGSWKNYDADAVIPAGTGFIMQTNVDTWNYFHAVDNANKALCVSNREIVKTLDVNASENASNRGWNLVGNPWQCYYNDHMLNFTGPITVWSVGNKTYTAYSITDDDYAIAPNEAFFVQCPNAEYNTIGFPTQGRQLTNVIEQQNAAPAMFLQASGRQVINLTVSNGEMEDQTRVVLNDNASMGYELTCDAGKFMSMDGSVPQIYTLDAAGNQYAINERPFADGSVQMGFYAGQNGQYTLSVKRCDAEQAFIYDAKTGMTVEITNSDYTFSAEAGTYDNRFTLLFANSEMGISGMQKDGQMDEAEVWSVDGKLLGTDVNSLGAGVYVVRQGKKVSKVVVR